MRIINQVQQLHHRRAGDWVQVQKLRCPHFASQGVICQVLISRMFVLYKMILGNEIKAYGRNKKLSSLLFWNSTECWNIPV